MAAPPTSKIADETPIIEWNADRTEGIKRTKHSRLSVLSTREAVRKYLQNAFLCWVEKPETQAVNPSRILSMAHPGIAHVIQRRIMQELTQLMPQWVEQWRTESRQIAEEKRSDTQFLGTLTRDYRKGCAVCQTDSIMGTTCGCGHTEIAVFRPCGHAMCVNPCFEQWMKINHVLFAPQEVTLQGQRFTIPNKSDLSTLPPNRYPCPECRTPLRSVFRAEDISSVGIETLPWDDWVDIVTANAGFAFWPEK